MFKRKTLFVLGAGTSKEAGLPVGVKLAKTISGMLDVDPSSPHNDVGEMLLGQLYNQRPLPNNGYHQAAMQISKGVRFANSIDDFLDRLSDDEHIQQVGKMAIVKSILDAEAVQLRSLRRRVETQLRPPMTFGVSEQRARHCRSALAIDHSRGQRSCRRGASRRR